MLIDVNYAFFLVILSQDKICFNWLTDWWKQVEKKMVAMNRCTNLKQWIPSALVISWITDVAKCMYSATAKIEQNSEIWFPMLVQNKRATNLHAISHDIL
jgi:hypothetical protein